MASCRTCLFSRLEPTRSLLPWTCVTRPVRSLSWGPPLFGRAKGLTWGSGSPTVQIAVWQLTCPRQAAFPVLWDVEARPLPQRCVRTRKGHVISQLPGSGLTQVGHLEAITGCAHRSSNRRPGGDFRGHLAVEPGLPRGRGRWLSLGSGIWVLAMRPLAAHRSSLRCSLQGPTATQGEAGVSEEALPYPPGNSQSLSPVFGQPPDRGMAGCGRKHVLRPDDAPRADGPAAVAVHPQDQRHLQGRCLAPGRGGPLDGESRARAPGLPRELGVGALTLPAILPTDPVHHPPSH